MTPLKTYLLIVFFKMRSVCRGLGEYVVFFSKLFSPKCYLKMKFQFWGFSHLPSLITPFMFRPVVSTITNSSSNRTQSPSHYAHLPLLGEAMYMHTTETEAKRGLGPLHEAAAVVTLIQSRGRICPCPGEQSMFSHQSPHSPLRVVWR